MRPGQQEEYPEKLHTVQEAATLLNVHTWKLRRAIAKGLIPSYSLLNARRLVRISEILAVINAGGRS
jgi:excisionase family DNA binding protein